VIPLFVKDLCLETKDKQEAES